MKKFIITLLTLLTFSTFSLSAEDMNYYNNMLKYAETTVTRLNIAQQVVDAKPEGAQDFYVSLLDFLVRDFPNIKGNSEVDAANKLCSLLAVQLGEGKTVAAGQDLWRAQEEFTDPLVKAAILEALGKMQFPEALPKVVQLLNDLNFNPHAGQDADGEEKVAYGAILSLEAYGDASGYLPVYFASVGWYKDRVKSKAREALEKIKIEGDPSSQLLQVIQSPYPMENRLTALKNIEASQDIPKESKSKVAVAALQEGWRIGTRDKHEITNLASMRLLAINMIIKYGTDDAAVYPLLDRSYREGVYEAEQIGTSETQSNGITHGGAINALVSLKSDESAKLMEGYLDQMNKRLQNNTLRKNVASDDWARTRVLIVGLGNLGKASSRAVLITTSTAPWTGWIQGLARTALKKLAK